VVFIARIFWYISGCVCYRRLVGLVVAMPAVADEVDDHVLGEALAEVVRKLGDERHRFRVVAVHMQHRCADHLGHVSAVQRRARVFGGAGGEADLVVDDDVHRAADGEAARLRHLEQFHHHALAGERGVAVHQDRQHHLAIGVAAAQLARAHAADDHRIDDFQVRGVEGEGDVHGAARRGHVGAEAHVVLHVAGVRSAVVLVVLELAFELVEQLARRLAERVHQHVEAAAVGHAHHHFLDALFAAATDHHVEHRDQAVAAFQREALLADVLGVQVTLQAFGRGEAFEDPGLLFLRAPVVARGGFEALLHPPALLDVGDVHVLGTDAAGVRRLQQRDQVAQLHAVLARDAAGAEFRGEVAFGQMVEPDRQIRCFGLDRHAERIEVGGEMTARTVRGDQLAHGAFALVATAGAGLHPAAGGALAGGRDLFHDHRMRDVSGLATFQPVEIGLPFRPHAVGGNQVLLVQVFEIGGVGAELRGLGELLQETVHNGVGKLFRGGKRLLRREFRVLPPRR
jgi:hypothetical protein